MLLAIPTPLYRRRPAFSVIFLALLVQYVFAIPFAAVRGAGLPFTHHLVGAATKHALVCTAAVFCAETLANRVGGASRHGARLLSAAVFEAMRRSRVSVGGASCRLARSVCAVLGTDATCLRKSGAAFLLAHCLAATAVLDAPASGSDGTGALVERAGPKCAVFIAHSPSFSVGAATFDRARHRPAVVFPALPSYTDGVVDARVQGAVSIGAVFDADKPAKDLRGVAVWIGA